MRFLRLLVVASALAFLTAGAAGCGETNEDGNETERVSLRDLKLCERPNLPDRLRCGTIDLPLERADPSLGSIEIAYAVLPGKQEAGGPRKGLVGIEGGPGYGSIGSATFYQRLFGDVLESRDLIMVDARGTGLSEPINCPDLQSGTTTPDIGVAACAEQLGERSGSYRTAAIADDIDSVLTALGYETVQVYGDSYGTYAAQSFAFRHPDRLERLALEGAFPVRGESAWYPSTWRTAIRSLGIVCRRTPDCRGNAMARLDRFVAGLKDDGYSLGPFLDHLAEAGYSPPGSYREINRMVSSFLAGDRDPYFEMTKQVPDDIGAPAAYSVGMELTVSCNDYPMLWDKSSDQSERYRELLAEVRDYPKRAFSPFTPREIALSPEYLYLECLAAPRPDSFYEPPADADAPAPDIPVLVVNGELDNVTSPEEGRATAALFPDSKVHMVPNGGHVYALYYPGTPAAEKIREFLR